MSNEYTKTDLITAIYNFSKGHKVQCRIDNSIWSFDLTKNNGTIILNQKMIECGIWYVLFE